MPAAIRIDLCSTAEVAPGNALKVDKAQNVIGRMERLRSLRIAQNQSRQTPAGARNP